MHRHRREASSRSSILRILLLGGTGEARHLAGVLGARADLSVTLSYAGRTPIRGEQPVPVRIGGFGGVDGFRAALRAGRIAAVIDATHPFAARMSGNAAAACAAEGTPLARLVRPAWVPETGDCWRHVADFAAAAAALGDAPRRVFLTIGQGGVDAFAAAPRHFYVVRSIGAPEGLVPPRITLLLDRPPYEAQAEEALMRAERIDILVTKNSGGAATAGKLVAARRLGLPVIMIERPPLAPSVPEFDDTVGIVRWLADLQAERGV